MKKALLIFLLASFSERAAAFLPDLGHLIRHQPMLLRSNPRPFTVSGSIEIEGDKAPFTLTWAGQKRGYSVEFKRVPQSWSTNPVGSLTLFRQGDACVLLLGKVPFPCSKLRFWGDFEFNASATQIVKTLSGLGLAQSSDLGFFQIDSKKLDPLQRKSNVKPKVKTIQKTFMSVLEYPGPNGTFLDFDSITYAPVMARVPVDGMMWDFSGSPNFHLEREESRNNQIISRRIEIKEGERTIAVVKRDPLTRVTSPELPQLPSLKGVVSDVPYDRFNEQGRNFLKVLFLTH